MTYFNRFLILTFILGFTYTGFAQDIPPTSADDREASIKHRHQMREQSIFKDYPVRNVGPVVMSGRVTDIAVYNNPRNFLVAYASGGVFRTHNSGNTFEPIFDNQGALTIGDIAISNADQNVIWVGTGENNSSRSSYSGTGIYKSTDNGKSWSHMGLTGTQHIGRIITHPTDPQTAWVASQGPLYSTNNDRGVYKTTNGGKTWSKTFVPADSTGVIDLVAHPENPDIMWASTWERFRQAWNFKEGGEGSAIYKSTDGGETWQKSVAGFPKGKHVGRIGLDVSRSNPDLLYAFLDNQYETKTKQEETDTDQLTQNDFVEMSKEEFLNLDDKKLERYLRSNRFPEKYTAQKVKLDVKDGKYEPRALSDYLGDANEALFDTEITGAEVYRSTDGGASWEKVQNYALDNVIFTYGYYFGEIRVDPTNSDVIYIMGVPALKSTDGGKTWKTIAENQPVHVDHHAMWIDPADSEHILLGNDGGLYESHDGGENFIHHNSPPVGQFYTIEVDMEKPYNIYGGLQDNGVFTGSSQGSWDDGQEWKRLFGGDGMHVQVDPRNSDIIYTGFQFGNYFRINQGDNSTTSITPRHEVGEDRYRYNWNTPVEMSNHNPDIIYFGSQKMNRSFDQGETWETISPDLTHDLPQGNVPYSTITTISESPLDFNVIWAGTDDGNVQVTQDGGTTWTNVSESLPDRRWVSEVHASEHDPAVAYASLNGYRYDEFKTYVYKTTDYGKTWNSVKGNLPENVTNIIIEDPKMPGMLYAGLDHGTFVSFDDGNEWHLLNGIPNAASYSMIVHPRDLELVVGTHGRSIYVADLKPIHKVAKSDKSLVIADHPVSIRHSGRWGQRSVEYRDPYMPSTEWIYWLDDKNASNAKVTVTIKDEDGKTVTSFTDEGSHGFNTLNWNLKINDKDGEKAKFIDKGSYKAVFKKGTTTDEVSFEVK